MDPFQVVFRQPVFDYEKKSIWSSTLLIPVYLGLVSIGIVLLHLLLLLTPLKKYLLPPRPTSNQTPVLNEHYGLVGEINLNIKSNGGFEIWFWKVLRLLGCFALVAVSIACAIIETDDTVHTDGKHWGKKHRHRHRHKHSKFSDYAILQLALAGLYAYAGILALSTLIAPKRLRRPVKNHLVSILFTTWCVYLYRDIWPLGTFTLQPVDPPIWTTWAAIGLLTVTAVVIPLLMPHEYVPVDPDHPSKEPNPEQTASWWSFHLYTFMDPIVYKAAFTEHLEYEALPPIADYDTSAYLRETSFPHMDPTKLGRHRHLFWGLVAHFYKDFILLAVFIFVKVVVGFAGPLGINRLLNYIETNGEGAMVRPWVWISWLFIGPMVGTLAMQWYIFTNTRTLVRIESIIVQLVFEHALRIRIKDEVPAATDQASGATTAIATPDSELAPTPTNGDTTGAHGSGHSQPATDSTAVGSSLGGPSASTASTVAKGKGKHKKAPSIALSISSSKGTAAKGKDKDKEKQKDLIGRINNFISTDVGNIVDSRDFLFMVWYCPLQIVICVWFLYSILGVAAFLGMGVLIISIPLPSVVATVLNRVQTERMKRTDARVQVVTEYMNILRMIKQFAWEPKVNEKVIEKREDELLWTKKRQLLQLLNMNTNYVIPLLTMLVTYSTYTLVFKHDLTASRVFSSMAVFDMLRDQLHIVLWHVGTLVQGKVSLDRITEFLNKTELLDAFTESSTIPFIPVAAPTDPNVIGFRNATFQWAETLPNTPATPGRRNFRLKIENELFFKRGAINMIIGPTGAGKTSILMALLGEMHFVPSGPDSWFNLPRAGGVSYATQESWVENETIKNNIVFGAPFDEERYKKVLYQCALEKDLDMFEAGDETEVGEKGLTLSGGQKARVTLARAIYSRSETILLDDVLSALDVHTSAWIVDKCFRGDLIKDRTILLVTHNVAMVSPVAKYVVAIGLDGRIASQGTLEQALATDSKLAADLKKEKEKIAKQEEVVDKPIENEKPAPKSTGGKLIVAEEIALGRVSWPALKMFLSSLGGFVFWVIFISSFVAADVLSVLQTFWLGVWASQYEKHAANEVNVVYYLTVYGVLLLIGMVVYSTGYTVYLFGAISAARKIHDRLMTAILGTTFRWLDVTPVGRIISRFTQDIRAVDGPVAGLLADWVELSITMVVKFIAVVYMTPVFAIPGILVGGLGSYLGNIYIKAQLSVKREMSNAKSPVFSHFNAAIAGLPSIRAYGAQDAFRLRTTERVDKYTRCARTYYNLNRWISFRIDFLGALFSTALASYLIYVRPQSASNIGFSITMAVAFSGMILWWVRIGNEFEVSCNSLERIDGYINCDQEPKPTESGKPPAYWPSSGHLVVEKLSASYSKESPQVLSDISFEIKSGERIGVVGRTGSGKSSLTLSLLRLIPTKGAVMYDGLATEHINLNALRTNITIIPQQPELLSGTLRENLDPFDEYDDAVLNDALRSAGLENVQSEVEEERITLDTPISAGGSNFSLGQRQIIALARAICRQSKILILDEATAAIDHETDTMIQNSIRTELKDVTVITVAHRLKSIGDSDKIIVLDGGRLVEYDSPANLLKRENGYFKSLVDESGEKEHLYRMAGLEPGKDGKDEEKHHHWNPFNH